WDDDDDDDGDQIKPRLDGGETKLEVGRIDVSSPSQNLLRSEKEPREDKNLYNIQSRIPAINE
ncbi:hypothetical protein NEUTE2DRAFT_60952, partial [Neurospora tetrasperma FGSC 2509]